MRRIAARKRCPNTTSRKYSRSPSGAGKNAAPEQVFAVAQQQTVQLYRIPRWSFFWGSLGSWIKVFANYTTG